MWAVLEYMQGGALADVFLKNSLEDDQISLQASKSFRFVVRLLMSYFYGTRRDFGTPAYSCIVRSLLIGISLYHSLPFRVRIHILKVGLVISYLLLELGSFIYTFISTSFESARSDKYPGCVCGHVDA